MDYRYHLRASIDLVTTYEATRAGFVALALERNLRASPFIAQARALKLVADKVRKPEELVKIKDIKAALLTAAGISDKASKYLNDDDKTIAIKEMIDKFLIPAGDAFVEELVYRFLLTRGDTLGGSMRNIGGALAQRKLTTSIFATLENAGKNGSWLTKTGEWVEEYPTAADLLGAIRGCSWGKRTLIYNYTVPFIKNNVDACLFNCDKEHITPDVCKKPDNYIAVGELKGGIDPAGADEHWKTAATALIRIQKAFLKNDLYVKSFFIGAAIAERMALEIYTQLEKGELTNAANLTKEEHVAALCNWLIKL